MGITIVPLVAMPNGCILQIEKEWIISQAQEIRGRILGALASFDTLIMDLCEVNNPDLCLLQIIMALKKSVAMQGKTLYIKNPGPSQSLREMVRTAGFSHISQESKTSWLDIPLLEVDL